MNDELIKDIKGKLYTNTGKISFKKINSTNNKDLKKEIINRTQFLSDNTNFNERIYCILNNITSQPLCIITNTLLKFNNNTQTYNKCNKFTPRLVSDKSKDLFKETIATKNNNHINELNTIYINKKYELLDVNKLKEFIVLFRTKYRNITPALASKYINEVCSTMHYSQPNYFYIKDTNILESRVKYQKHKLKDKLELFDEAKTETENMILNNYRIIYDCGNKVYEYVKS